MLQLAEVQDTKGSLPDTFSIDNYRSAIGYLNGKLYQTPDQYITYDFHRPFDERVVSLFYSLNESIETNEMLIREFSLTNVELGYSKKALESVGNYKPFQYKSNSRLSYYFLCSTLTKDRLNVYVSFGGLELRFLSDVFHNSPLSRKYDAVFLDLRYFGFEKKLVEYKDIISLYNAFEITYRGVKPVDYGNCRKDIKDVNIISSLLRHTMNNELGTIFEVESHSKKSIIIKNLSQVDEDKLNLIYHKIPLPDSSDDSKLSKKVSKEYSSHITVKNINHFNNTNIIRRSSNVRQGF